MNEPWNDDWSDEKQLNAYIADLTGQSNSLTLGYFDGGSLAALSMGHIKHWYTGTEYYIDEFCVDESCRRQGIATAMVDFIRQYAKEKGLRRIELNMWEFNRDALAFYEAAGFRTYRRYMEMFI